jgi:hypothetical protein
MRSLMSIFLTKYYSGNQIELNGMCGACSAYGGADLVGKPDGKKPHGKPGHRWEDNIKMDHQEVGLVTWTGLIWLKIRTGGGLL